MSTLVDFPCSLPTIPISSETDASTIALDFSKHLPHLEEHHFVQDAVWRDIFALTGTLRTFYSASSISEAWQETTKRAKAGSFVLDQNSARIVHLPQGSSWVETRFVFATNATPQTTCSGFMNLIPGSDGKWRIWVLRSILEHLKSGDVDVLEPVVKANGLPNGQQEPTHFDCVIIGGGQAGLSTAGRMKTLGISYVVMDKHQNVGDNWKTRYSSARLHTSREYAHLPFERTFPPCFQQFLSKDDMAEGYQSWVSKFDINIWLDTTPASGTWDSSKESWTLSIRRHGKEQSITCSYIIVAGGAGGQVPKMPNYPNRIAFTGTVLHSAEYTDASKWKGKHGVVIGTANTAHDVAVDMVEAGLSSVTMIQRSKTYVLPVEYYMKISNLSYNATNPTTTADRSSQTQPVAILDLISQVALHEQARQEPERFDALERAGFKLDRWGSIQHCLYARGGGHYIDVGGSEMVANGLIKIKSDSLPSQYTTKGLEFDDGTHLKADIIVFATGFEGNMRYLVHEIFGDEVAESMGDYWGLNSEGELKGAFRPCGNPAMWYHGGTIGQARYYSRFLALQVKARLLGTPLPLY
ncbi:dimethylaniline monooxygenase (N-oxide forming) [Leptodontidium sp. MPI-SDFR-AT-0119]|nr:dimethylaniline monooxygenase (N-oxide forming) [Leptodontidium sp. MPI-SDFR-AT-0119]KAH6711599.1 dimethylaniline monooxygenase (N-oxide forming) [Leptodontidium sp. MPI-SDFR-AT-0119]